MQVADAVIRMIRSLLNVQADWYLCADNGAMTLVSGQVSLPVLLPNQLQALFVAHPGQGIVVTDSQGMHWGFLLWSGQVLVIGPYLTGTSKPKYVLSDLALPVLGDEQCIAALSTAQECLNDKGSSAVVQVTLTDNPNDQTIYESVASSMLIERAHDIEIMYMDAIQAGSTAQARYLFSSIWNQNDRSASSVEGARRGYIVFRTMTRLAARFAGVPSSAIVRVFEAHKEEEWNIRQADDFHRLQLTVIDEICALVQRLQNQQGYPPLVKQVMAYVAAHLNENLSVADIAAHVGSSASHVSSTFSKHVGTPLSSYITAERLNKAAVLLALDTISIGEVSTVVGINDNSYFAKLFKKKYGMTPMQYRKIKQMDKTSPTDAPERRIVP